MDIRSDTLAQIREALDPEAAIYAADAGKVPDHWRDYLGTTSAERLFCLRQEMQILGRYLPDTAEVLTEKAIDVMLVEGPVLGLARVIIVLVDDATYPTYSLAPGRARTGKAAQLLLQSGPDVLKWIYGNLMDGLTDLYDFGGFKNSNQLVLMSAESDTYAEADWYQNFKTTHQTDRIIEIFSSGGGGYLLVNIDDPQLHAEPAECILVDLNDKAAPENVPLYSYLDEWTAIAQGE